MMNMINVTLVGILVKAPEQVCFPSGRIKATLKIAVHDLVRKTGQNDVRDVKTDYYRVEVWGKQAELACLYLRTGNQVGVSGRLIMERWTDKEGRERMTPVVAASQLQFPPKNGSSGSSPSKKPDASGEHFGPAEADTEEFRSGARELFEGAKVLSVTREAPSSYSPFRAPRRRA